MTKLLVISDLHCGHIVGLTPKKWDSERPMDQLKKAYLTRRAIWDWYARTVAQIKPDVLIINGDCLDGRGEKSGGTELLYMDRNDQVDMAADCILEANAKTVLLSYGTAYHTGREEDFERPLANKVGAEKIGSVDNADINGCIVNYRHFVPGSQVPHGRFTALARDKVWNELWAARNEYPLADIIIRSHVHYFGFVGGYGWVAMTTPGLQGYGSKYGARHLSGTVDIGVVSFDITRKENWTWQPHILRLPKTEAVAAVGQSTTRIVRRGGK